MNENANTNPAVAAAVNQAVQSLTFKGVSAAAKYLATEKGLDISNARDCIYKSLRTQKGGKTHGYKPQHGNKRSNSYTCSARVIQAAI